MNQSRSTAKLEWSMMQRIHLLQLALFVFAVSLAIRIPFAFHPAVLHIREAEYIDLARSFAAGGRGRGFLTWQLLKDVKDPYDTGNRISEASHPLLLPLASGGILSLAVYFHPEPEKMLAYSDSWEIARILNTIVGSITVAVWFVVAASLMNSLVLAFLFAILLTTNPALVQNSAMNMPEQWLLLLMGLTFWSWQQKRTNASPIVLAALVFAFLMVIAISAGNLISAILIAAYLPLPFWWLFGAIAWLSKDRRSMRLFACLIIAINGLMLLAVLLWTIATNPYAGLNELVEIAFLGLLPILFALPFILLLLIWCRFFGWESEGALWAGIGGAIASLAPYARPEGLLFILAMPFVLTKSSHRLAAFSCWLLGLILSLLIFWKTNHSLPSTAWLLNFLVLDFPTNSWRLYGQPLPSFWEFVSANWNIIIERILTKAWLLSLHLLYALGLLLFAIPLMFWLWKAKANLNLSPLANALPFVGLLFFATHCFVWSTPSEPRLILVPLVLFALWFFCLWLRWLQNQKFALRPVALFAVSVTIVLIINVWSLFHAWRTEPQWNPEALKLAASMTKAMVALDPMEEEKLSGGGVVSNMPWLLFLHVRGIVALMPLLDTPEKLEAFVGKYEFVSKYKPEAFIFLLCGRTPKQAIDKEPRAKAWLIWHRGKLKLRPEWASRLELVDWRLFHNRSCVNIVAMLVPKDSQAKLLPL